MKIDGIKAYQIYNKYWISRHFVEMFGFGFLTNNGYVLNNFFKFKDLGDLKKICWMLAGFNKEASNETIDIFYNRYESLNDFEKETVAHHIGLMVDGLKQRFFHFNICREALCDFCSYIDKEYTDNIYNLNERFGEYQNNVFEVEFCNQNLERPLPYNIFIDILQKDNENIEIENKGVEYNFKEIECSI